MGQPLSRRTIRTYDQYVAASVDARVADILARAGERRNSGVMNNRGLPDSKKVAANLEILKRCGITREAPLPQIPTAPSGTISQVLQITEYGAVVVEGLDDPVSAKTVETWIDRYKAKRT